MRSLKIIVPTVAVLATTSAIAVAAIPSAGGALNGCYTTGGLFQGSIRIVDEGVACRAGEQLLTWNTKGQKGDPGATGPQGPAGPAGPAGAAGGTGGSGSTTVPDADITLKLDGVAGESTVDGHRDEIDLSSFAFGLANSASIGAGTGGGAGRNTVDSFRLTKTTDSSTPALMRGLLTGRHFQSATITFRRRSGARTEFLRYRLTDVIITGLDQGGKTDPAVLESLKIDARKFAVEYTPQTSTGGTGGTIPFGWDQAANAEA